jgi:predicted nucleic acid-binding Zn ribbon protein
MELTISFDHMPTYVYKFVKTGETIEVQQSFTDPTLTKAVHPETGRKMSVKKVFLPVGVSFKGDGFYKTDSRAAKKSDSNGGKESSESSSTGSDSGSDAASKSESKGSDSKPSDSKSSDSKSSDSKSSEKKSDTKPAKTAAQSSD